MTQPRLSRNALSLSQIIGSTLANIGPALGVIFSFGLITGAAGVGAPITIIVAMLTVLFLGNTLAQFCRHRPSTGSFVTFIGVAFGPAAGAAAALFVIVGYCFAAASIVAVAGGWVHDVLRIYGGISVNWQLIEIVSTIFTGLLVSRGIGMSTAWATVFFYFEVGLLMVSAVVLFWVHRGFLSTAPFLWSNVTGGLKGLGLGFPFAVYLFIGWENSAMLAEETENPRRNIPRALFAGTLAVGSVYLVVVYAVITAFHNNPAAMAGVDSPFVQAIRTTFAPLGVLVYAAGLTSLLSCLIGLTNGQARILFSAAREGLLPAVFARVHPRYKTPAVAILCYISAACVIVLICGFSADPVTIFNETGTFGTLVLIVTYIATNAALPVYMRRYHRADFSILFHLVIPTLGTALMLVPAWGLIQPGQPFPYNYFPAATLALLFASIVYGVILSRRTPDLAVRIGSWVADAD